MKKWMYNGLIIFFAAVFLVSAGFLASYFIDAYRQSRRYEDLSGLRQTEQTRPLPTEGGQEEAQPTTLEPETVEITDPLTGQKRVILKEFETLYLMNPDMVGWLSIPGTDIDYPVMQTPDRPDFYLKRNFDKEYSARGCLYAREVCNVFAPSDNITIYGHRMRDGSMFARLDQYQDKSYFEQNPYLFFDTLQEKHTYKILAVFTTTATAGEGFGYHEFVSATDEGDFDSFVATCKQLSLYDTGVDAAYGDKLITLSTCEYTHVNGRLVVVAKRIA